MVATYLRTNKKLKIKVVETPQWTVELEIKSIINEKNKKLSDFSI